MFTEGIKLMVIGMGTVFLFLSFSILCITIVAKLTKGHAQRELNAVEAERAERKRKAQAAKGAGGPPVAVLAAAVQAFESSKK